MCRIAIDTRAIPHTGIARYSRELLRHIPRVAPDLDCRPFCPEAEASPERPGRSERAMKRLVYECFGLGRYLARQDFALFHCTKNYGIPLKASCPVITTIHDIIPLALRTDYLPSPVQWAYYRFSLWLALTLSDAVITISSFSRDELLRHFPKLQEKTIVIPQGCIAQPTDGMDDERARVVMGKLGVTRPYLLTMGGAEPRKNVEMLVRAFEREAGRLPLDLVIIGDAWQGRQPYRPARCRHRVHYVSGISDWELAAAYTGAELFVFPSLYEGFGLPILEAMSHGTPVIAHSGSSIPEAAGDAALLVDMRSPGACLAAVFRLLDDPSLRSALVAKGQEQASRFTWEKTAAHTAQVYRRLLIGGSIAKRIPF